MMDLAWTTQEFNLNSWVQNYTIRRYGIANTQVMEAWNLLQNTVYDCSTQQQGTSGSIVVARPAFDIVQIGCCATTKLYYNPDTVVTAWKLLLNNSNQLQNQQTYLNDLVQVTITVLSNLAMNYYNTFTAAFDNKNKSSFDSNSAIFLQIAADMDSLLGTQQDFLLGTWIDNAIYWGNTTNEKVLMQENARRQITLWGGPWISNTLNEYAYKLWSGLISDFYIPRWKLFISQLENSLVNGTTFNYNTFLIDVINLEETWVKGINTFPITPTGNTIKTVINIYNKYFS